VQFRTLLLVYLVCSGYTAFVQAENLLPSRVPPLETGTLMIVGGGDELDVLQDAFLELAGGRSADIVHIPTATQHFESERDDPAEYGYWHSLPAKSFQFLHTRDPREAESADFVRPLSAATGVWIGGGAQANLARIYGASELPRHLKEVLARGGVVAGTSAGASILSQTMISDQTPRGLEAAHGFALCPLTVVDCHFTKRQRVNRMLRMLETFPTHNGIGVDDNTALVVRQGTATVIGQGTVTLFATGTAASSPERIVLRAGQSVSLPRLPALPMPAPDTSLARE
jgi:cyanophycinase